MEQTKVLTERKYLFQNRMNKKELDMESIYRDIDSGMSLNEVCLKYDASRTTIYRHHKIYQEMVKEQKEKERIEERNESLPSLPDL